MESGNKLRAGRKILDEKRGAIKLHKQEAARTKVERKAKQASKITSIAKINLVNNSHNVNINIINASATFYNNKMPSQMHSQNQMMPNQMMPSQMMRS